MRRRRRISGEQSRHPTAPNPARFVDPENAHKQQRIKIILSEKLVGNRLSEDYIEHLENEISSIKP
jgi:rRNA maturation protein Nop10